ncbi:MAG: efflux RND transporter periplasmic adaptor subunit [Breznakibacter sp.]
MHTNCDFTKLTIVIILTLISVSCTPSVVNYADTAKRSYTEPSQTNVTVATARRSNFSRELISNGKLAAVQRAVVPFAVQEQITEVAVTEGQAVVQGQLLARVDGFGYALRLADARNGYQKALIDLEDLLLGHGHALTDTAKIPANILNMCKIRSGYAQAVNTLAEATRNHARTHVTAPIAGVVANLQVLANNPSSSYKYCCEILDLSALRLEFPILESETGFAQSGQQLSVEAFALPGKQFGGKVLSVNPSVDEKGMVKVTALISNPSRELIDGMNAKVWLRNQVPGCLIVPKQAVLYRQNRKVVFVHQNGKAMWHYVQTGLENSTDVTIIEGLKAGDEVIVSNNLNLAHESPVTVVGDSEQLSVDNYQ